MHVTVEFGWGSSDTERLRRQAVATPSGWALPAARTGVRAYGRRNGGRRPDRPGNAPRIVTLQVSTERDHENAFLIGSGMLLRMPLKKNRKNSKNIGQK